MQGSCYGTCIAPYIIGILRHYYDCDDMDCSGEINCHTSIGLATRFCGTSVVDIKEPPKLNANSLRGFFNYPILDRIVSVPTIIKCNPNITTIIPIINSVILTFIIQSPVLPKPPLELSTKLSTYSQVSAG